MRPKVSTCLDVKSSHKILSKWTFSWPCSNVCLKKYEFVGAASDRLVPCVHYKRYKYVNIEKKIIVKTFETRQKSIEVITTSYMIIIKKFGGYNKYK